MKVCHKAEVRTLYCQLLLSKWGQSSPISFTKCYPGDTVQGRLPLCSEDPQSLQGNLEIIPEKILWQLHICISFCNCFLFSQLPACRNLSKCLQKANLSECKHQNKHLFFQGKGAAFPRLQPGAICKSIHNSPGFYLPPQNNTQNLSDCRPPYCWAILVFWEKKTERQWYLIPLSDASSLNSPVLLNCSKLYFCSVTLTNGHCGHYFHFKLDPNSSLHGWINELIYFIAVLSPQ